MAVSAAPWIFLSVAAVGLALSAFLHFRSPISRRIPILLSAAAWLGLAALMARPLWVSTRVVYHPPTVALGVDLSPSYARGETLRIGDWVRRSMGAIRDHYAALGFHVTEFGFREAKFPDSLEVPNLQAIFLWSDGRFPARGWPALVYPVIGRAGAFSEVQGESVVVDSVSEDSGAEASVEWRSLGSGGAARLEVQAGGKTLWRERLPNSGTPPGTLLRRVFKLSPRMSAEISGSQSPLALIRPEADSANVFSANDTLDIRLAGRARARHFFARPLRSLEERGLVDALLAAESLAVSAVSASAAPGLQPGDVIWARASSAVFAPHGATVVSYSFPQEGGGSRAFSSEARVAWGETAVPFLPAGVLRLGDLGEGLWVLDKPDSMTETLAWAEEGGRKGALLSRKGTGETFVFKFASPRLWASAFRPDADDRVRALQRRWVQGVGNLAHHQAASVKGALAGNPKTRDPEIQLRSRLGIDREALSALGASTHGAALFDTAADGTKNFSHSLPDFPRGHLRVENRNSRPLFPFTGMAFAVAGFLCAAWALRKKFHLD